MKCWRTVNASWHTISLYRGAIFGSPIVKHVRALKRDKISRWKDVKCQKGTAEPDILPAGSCMSEIEESWCSEASIIEAIESLRDIGDCKSMLMFALVMIPWKPDPGAKLLESAFC